MRDKSNKRETEEGIKQFINYSEKYYKIIY